MFERRQTRERFPPTCQHVTSALDNCIGTRFWCSVCLSPRRQIIPLRRGWARPEEPACHIHIRLSGQLIQIGDPDSRRRQGTRQGGRRRDPLALLLIRFLFSLFCGAAIARSGPGDLLVTMQTTFLGIRGGSQQKAVRRHVDWSMTTTRRAAATRQTRRCFC